MKYRERGALVWNDCIIIAEYNGKVWIHNLVTGTMPMGRKSRFEFKE